MSTIGTAMSYATPEEAARAAVPGKRAKALFTDVSRDDAMVLLRVGPDERSYGYQVEAHHKAGSWVDGATSNGCSSGYTASGRAVLTFWDRSPKAAKVAQVRYRGEIFDCPVREGYFLLVIWDPLDLEYPSDLELRVANFID